MRSSMFSTLVLAVAGLTYAVAVPEAAAAASATANGPAVVLKADGTTPTTEELTQVSHLQERAAAPSPTVACNNFVTMVLANHNVHRANHSAPNLVWNQTVANHAYEWARQCNFAHNTSYGEGQNLAAGYKYVRDAITFGWYNGEMPNYSTSYGLSSPNMNIFESIGHFTQVVWKGTTSVGCASVMCPSIAGIPNAAYTVCNYYPPGNYLGEFGDNVGRPLGRASTFGTCS